VLFVAHGSPANTGILIVRANPLAHANTLAEDVKRQTQYFFRRVKGTLVTGKFATVANGGFWKSMSKGSSCGWTNSTLKPKFWRNSALLLPRRKVLPSH
jgi:hypothetical protein